jgi:hypothetical protein
MFSFLRDMFIGWIVFTQDGKKVANKVVTYVYKNIKKNVKNSQQYKEIVGLKDIFVKDSEVEDESNRNTKFNNRPKN